ncbi:MAG: DnaJ domain-containing protein [Prevotella sp.]|jgi:DnaJ like chaperone protein|nr:DnaJ domain-containing protein [Prevotella sp.]
MAYGKWIGGFLGMMVAGPLGAIAGFVLGSLFDNAADSATTASDGNGQFNGPYDGYQTQQQAYEGQRNTFRFSLLVLASYIIRADGKVMHSEMNTVRQWLRINFGEEAVVQGDEILRKLFEQQNRLGMTEFRTAVMDSCRQLRQIMPYEQRLQLLHFLVTIAQADGVVVDAEVNALRECTIELGLSVADLEGMLNLRDAGSSLDAAYKVLGVSPSATDDEVKAAYRKLALKNHPDRVASLGEDVRKAAEQKFQEINAAMETVKKARGL